MKSFLATAKRKSKVENGFAGMAKLADAPDLGFRNHRFPFQNAIVLRGENAFLLEGGSGYQR